MGTPWQEYDKGEREPLIEQMLSAYSHLVDYQVQRVLFDLPASVERDDLASEARIGLIDAINRYDPAKNVKFETYASIRIHGAIVDYLRKLDWAPRSLRQRARQISAAGMALEQELGEVPTEEQLAQRMGLSLTEYQKLLSDISVLTVLSFRDLEEGESDFQLKDTLAEPEKELAKQDFIRCLGVAIDKLPEREKLILELYYRKLLSLKEIGVVLSLSESRICQIHSQAVIRLRGMLEDWREDA